MIGYGFNKKTKSIDISGDYNMLDAFCDKSCYEILTAEEVAERGIDIPKMSCK